MFDYLGIPESWGRMPQEPAGWKPALQPVPLTSLHAANTVPWRGLRLPDVAQSVATRGRRDDGEGLDFQPATLKLIAA